jgi:hypothetical protein
MSRVSGMRWRGVGLYAAVVVLWTLQSSPGCLHIPGLLNDASQEFGARPENSAACERTQVER